MLATLKLSLILIREQCREPVGIFWALIAPAGFFCFANWSDRNIFLEEGGAFLLRAGWYLAYIGLMTALFGFGLYLIGRRESGFIRTFAYASRSRMQFIGAQFLASLTLSILYGLFFMLVTSLAFQPNISSAPLFALLIRFICTTMILMVGCVTFSALPLTFQTASSLMSILSMPLIMLGLASTRTDAVALHWINFVNPYFVAGEFISGGVTDFSVAPILHFVLLLALGIYGLLCFKINPIWSRY
ncbi:hypothetical protein [Herbaspirillum sp. NPDC101396]|uniref:hypothetical protein n=1 Tax=Herbaspirillum sp. NPDC101396 TaxID=3364005 RepID=UPI00383B38FE